MQNKVFSMIGIAAKAGKVVSGEFSTEKAIKAGKAKLVIVSADASGNTKKNFTDMTAYYQVPLCFLGTREALGHCIGKEFRASVAIVDENLARTIEKKLREDDMLKLNNGGN